MIRQIVQPDSNRIILDIPNEFVGHSVEVIAFQIEDEVLSDNGNLKDVKKSNSKARHERLMNFIKKHPIKLPKGYKFNREELYE